MNFEIVNASWWGNLFGDAVSVDMPSVNQDNMNVIVSMNIPNNMDPDEIVVEIKDQQVRVYGKTGQQQEVREEGFYEKKVSSSSFNRSVSLPCEVDALGTRAELRDGLLIITMPKVAAEDKSFQKIRVVRV